MRKLFTHFFHFADISFVFLICFFFADRSYSQDFITVWTFTDDAPVIRFNALTSGDVNYSWTTTPSSKSGQGTFNKIVAGRVTINNLEIEEGDTLILSIAPDNLSRFFSDYDLRNSPEILLDVKQWGSVLWTSMENAFYYREEVNFSAADLPNLTYVYSMRNMFSEASDFNSDISLWDVSSVSDMSGMFSWAGSFNQDISGWDVSNVFDMSQMFTASLYFNQDIGDWNVSNVIHMRAMFASAGAFNQDIGSWNVSNAYDMSYMFAQAILFDQDLGDWDVSNVTNMEAMFALSNFNHYIGDWDVSNVTNINTMFINAYSFNQDLSKWDVSSITDMEGLFAASIFNQDLSTWNVSKVITMSGMFYFASSFNQDISGWDVSNVISVNNMFSHASSFNQDISDWTYHPDVRMDWMFDDSGLDCENYSKAISAWRKNSALANKTIGVEGLEYGSNKAEDRTYLIEEKGWTFVGDERSEEECGTVSTNRHNLSGGKIMLFPNPTYYSITIEAEAKELEGLRVLNVNGQDVSGLISIQRSENGINIDLSRLSPGIYVLRTPSNATKVIKM